MKRTYAILPVLALAASLVLSACSAQPEADAPVPPVQVEHLTGEQPTRVSLTEDAIQRLDLQTETVEMEAVNGAQQTVIPYSSIVYDTQGKTWVYTSPQAGTYLRTPVQVEFDPGR